MGGKVIDYNVCEDEHDNAIHYGIQVTDRTGEDYNEEMIEDISPSKDFIYNLLMYLYENSIDTVHFRDIVEDYIFKSEYAV
jgi:hypothetical protein